MGSGIGGEGMARINIEDDLEKHAQFWNLVALILPAVGGDLELARDCAVGKVTRFFRLAQKRFTQPENFPAETGILTEEDLRIEKLECMLTVGWAVPEGDGYQVKNARKHFNWLVTAKENGKKGGRPPKDKPEETGRLPDGTDGLPTETGNNHLYLDPDPSSSTTTTETDEFVSKPGRGAIPELADVPGAKKLLWEATHEMQRHWLAFLPIGLIRDEIPKCWSKLLANEHRKALGAWAMYANDWFKNKQEQLEKEIKAKAEASIKGKPPPAGRPLRNTGKPCEEGFYVDHFDGDGKEVRKSAGCRIHGFADFCAMHGRAPP